MSKDGNNNNRIEDSFLNRQDRKEEKPQRQEIKKGPKRRRLEISDPTTSKASYSYSSLDELSQRFGLEYIGFYKNKVKSWPCAFVTQLLGFAGFSVESDSLREYSLHGHFGRNLFELFKLRTDAHLTLRFAFRVLV